MKKYRLILSLLVVANAMFAASPQQEFRATWLTTHLAIDWPRAVGTSDSVRLMQQQELIDIFDRLQASNINAICFQVRPLADAYYRSSYEPWSGLLTGVTGTDPGYDPLEFAIHEAHNRGLELHAWVNPYRYEVHARDRVTAIRDSLALPGTDFIRDKHPDWLLTYRNGQFDGTILDPGNPEARAYVLDVVMEIVGKYDIDGLIMDDYFYPYGGTRREDARSQAQHKPAAMDISTWRRENVNTFVRSVHDSIMQVKPWVKLGMSPFGIYSMTDSAAAQFGLKLPAGISGTDVWEVLYCDPLRWVAEGYVDYLSPQLYWSTRSTKQNYEVLCRWWSRSVAAIDSARADGRQTHVYMSHADYRFDAEELGSQIDLNRQYAPHEAPGSIFYNTNQYLNYTGGKRPQLTNERLLLTHFADSVPTPVIPGKLRPAPADTSFATLVIPTDSLPACCDSIKIEEPTDSRFNRMTLRQKRKSRNSHNKKQK